MLWPSSSFPPRLLFQQLSFWSLMLLGLLHPRGLWISVSSTAVLCFCSSHDLFLLTIHISAKTSLLLWPFSAAFPKVARDVLTQSIILFPRCLSYLFPAHTPLWYALIFFCVFVYCLSILTYMFHEDRNLAWLPYYVFCTYKTSLLHGYWRHEWMSERKS